MEKYIWHGSTIPNIKTLEPRRRSTLGALGKDVPPAVYAGDDPAYCAAHAFAWGSAEGFNLYFDKNNKVVFEVPLKHKDGLQTKIYLYKVPTNRFVLLPNVSPKGHNFWSKEKVEVLSVEDFSNVAEGIEHYGDKVIYK